MQGLDLAAAQSWVYPSNVPVREYQLAVTGTALLRNTLVCLPTGLGKTLVAAVVMLNFRLWYPGRTVVFMVRWLVVADYLSCLSYALSGANEAPAVSAAAGVLRDSRHPRM